MYLQILVLFRSSETHPRSIKKEKEQFISNCPIILKKKEKKTKFHMYLQILVFSVPSEPIKKKRTVSKLFHNNNKKY
jgi:hypothetical protein